MKGAVCDNGMFYSHQAFQEKAFKRCNNMILNINVFFFCLMHHFGIERLMQWNQLYADMFWNERYLFFIIDPNGA